MIDILHPEISVVTKGLQGKSVLLYGTNRTGKTSNAVKADRAVVLRFEQGLSALAGVMNFPINKWSDWTLFVNQLTNPNHPEAAKIKEMYGTIIVDTVDAMLALGADYMCANFNVPDLGRDSSGKKGFGIWTEYRNEISRYVKKLTNSGYTVIFIGHDDTRTLKDDKGEEYQKIYPRGDKRSIDIIADICDIIAFAQPCSNNAKGEEVRSTLFLKGTPAFLAGSRFDYITPVIEEWNIEKLEKAITDAIEAEEKASGTKAVAFEAQKAVESKKQQKEEEAKISLEELIDAIGNKVKALYDAHPNDGQEIYLNLLDEVLHNREFRVSTATEKQREQLEQVLAAFNERGL